MKEGKRSVDGVAIAGNAFVWCEDIVFEGGVVWHCAMVIVIERRAFLEGWCRDMTLRTLAKLTIPRNVILSLDLLGLGDWEKWCSGTIARTCFPIGSS